MGGPKRAPEGGPVLNGRMTRGAMWAGRKKYLTALSPA